MMMWDRLWPCISAQKYNCPILQTPNFAFNNNLFHVNFFFYLSFIMTDPFQSNTPSFHNSLKFIWFFTLQFLFFSFTLFYLIYMNSSFLPYTLFSIFSPPSINLPRAKNTNISPLVGSGGTTFWEKILPCESQAFNIPSSYAIFSYMLYIKLTFLFRYIV